MIVELSAIDDYAIISYKIALQMLIMDTTRVCRVLLSLLERLEIRFPPQLLAEILDKK